MNEINPPMTPPLISARLIDVYKYDGAERILFDLLLERSTEDDPYVNISHRKMPTWINHCNFVASKPYWKWYLIEAVSWDNLEKHIELEPGSVNYATAIIGTCYITRRNEIGIVLLSHYRGTGFGVKAVNELIRKHKPLKEIPGIRSGRFIANINPTNEKSIWLFTKIGFTHLSETYVL